MYLGYNGQTSFITANYEAQKTKKFKQQIGRIENMRCDGDTDCFICAQGCKLQLRREYTERKRIPWRGTDARIAGIAHRELLAARQRTQTSKKSEAAENLLGKACNLSSTQYVRTRCLSEDVSFHSGRGRPCTAQARLWFPPFSDAREREHSNRVVLPDYGI